MVTFIPPYMGEEIKSNAERKMYDVLQELNLKNAYVLHSLGLPKHRSKIYGEVDFVVVCERGVACLEIKGGRVECHDGQWTFIDRYGKERVKPEGPSACQLQKYGSDWYVQRQGQWCYICGVYERKR